MDRAAERVLRALDRQLKRTPAPTPPSKPFPQPTSNIEAARYKQMVERCKEYARAGDVFQVVPSQRFSAPFAAPPFDFRAAGFGASFGSVFLTASLTVSHVPL